MKEKAYYIVSKARQILGGTISADQCRYGAQNETYIED